MISLLILPRHVLPPYDPRAFTFLLSLDLPPGASLYAAALFLFSALSVATPNTLVVCPAELRPALADWLELRQGQGHRILVVPPEETAEKMQAAIRRNASSGQLKFLVLIGDVPDPLGPQSGNRGRTVPTNYLRAKVNARWGSQPTIATDAPYADVNGDLLHDLAVGRIPADSPDELATVVRKIVRYEQQPKNSPARERICVTAGIGGFGVLADSLVEAAARQVFRQTIPADCNIEQLSANPASPHFPAPGEFSAMVRRQISSGGLAWIYLGHGLPTELDRVRTPGGEESILSVADVQQLHCGARGPIAVLIACYSGALDAQPDCLAEELLMSAEGPIAVIAATRVTMPYGNTVLGYELLRCCFAERPAEVGDLLRLAQQRTLESGTGDALRTSLDGLAHGISPPPLDLETERREHAMMYHLFGDPLTRLPPGRRVVDIAQTQGQESIAK